MKYFKFHNFLTCQLTLQKFHIETLLSIPVTSLKFPVHQQEQPIKAQNWLCNFPAQSQAMAC